MTEYRRERKEIFFFIYYLISFCFIVFNRNPKSSRIQWQSEMFNIHTEEDTQFNKANTLLAIKRRFAVEIV